MKIGVANRGIQKPDQKVIELGVKQVVNTIELEQTILPIVNRKDVELLVQNKPDIIQALPSLNTTVPRLFVKNSATNAKETDLALKAKDRAIASFRIKELIRLKNNISDILVMASNPKLNINTDFKNNRPSIQLELETKGYQAIASLEPFKNRN